MIQKSNSTVTINLRQLKKNVEELSKYLDKETYIMAVLKADAYGHGAVQVANALDSLVAAFAVNNIQEGIELRENGIDKPILVFEVPQKSFVSQYREQNLTATVSSDEHFEILPEGTAYHLNFDTGMGRLGFNPEEVKRVADLVQKNQQLSCTGIYSHFATSENPGSEMVVRQHQTFKKIRSHFSDKLTTHISNTGGTAFYKTAQFDMVRLGIGLYGYPPGETNIEGIAAVLEWKSELVQVKSIEANSTVSYGANWKAPAEGYLGIIPVGYEDGIKRSLSENIAVQIDSKEYPLVGTITMNYSMVFLQDDYFEPGTEVKLLHRKSDVENWAQKAGTIPYEILTSINPKIPREYL